MSMQMLNQLYSIELRCDALEDTVRAQGERIQALEAKLAQSENALTEAMLELAQRVDEQLNAVAAKKVQK